MHLTRFIWGWCSWHLHAGFWYLTLAFRLYFAVGLDRDFHPGKEDNLKRHFQCPYPRNYRRHLAQGD